MQFETSPAGSIGVAGIVFPHTLEESETTLQPQAGLRLCSACPAGSMCGLCSMAVATFASSGSEAHHQMPFALKEPPDRFLLDGANMTACDLSFSG